MSEIEDMCIFVYGWIFYFNILPAMVHSNVRDREQPKVKGPFLCMVGFVNLQFRPKRT